MAIINENEYHEKIRSKINEITLPKEFSTFSKLCRYFGITPPGTNSKKSLINVFAQYMVIGKTPGTSKHTIIRIIEYRLPKIDKKIKKSPLYLGCIYLLLDHLINHDKQNDYVLITKKELALIFGLGNSEYRSQNYFDIIDEDSTERTKYIIIGILNQIYKKTNDILDAAKKRNFLYPENTIYRYDKNREATEEEKKVITETRESVAKNYMLKNYKQVFFNPKRKEILANVEKELGYVAYDILKFRIDEQLENSFKCLEKVTKTEFNQRDLNNTFCEIVRKSFAENRNAKRKSKKAKRLLNNIDNNAVIDIVNYVIGEIIKI